MIKKEQITESKIYSPFGKFAERAKKWQGAVANFVALLQYSNSVIKKNKENPK